MLELTGLFLRILVSLMIVKLLYSRIPNGTQTMKKKIKIYTTGLGNILRHIRDNYKNPVLFISEQGYNNQGGLNDTDRVLYIKTKTWPVQRKLH
nr:beta-glucosidase 20-like [Leptinotarsa decemlineata]